MIAKPFTMKDIWNNFTEENLSKLEKGFFCRGTENIDFEETKKKAKTNKLFGLQCDVDIRELEEPKDLHLLKSL